MEVVFGAVVGLIAGALLAAVLYSSLKLRSDAQWEERVRKIKEEASQEALKRSAATLRGQVGERFALETIEDVARVLLELQREQNLPVDAIFEGVDANTVFEAELIAGPAS